MPSFTYAYHPHSSLVYTLKANNGAEDVLTTTKFWDKLNRLTSVSASSIGPDSELLYAYAHNDLNQRTQAVREDGRYWDYAYDDRGQVTLGQKKSSGGSVLSGFDFGYDYDFIGNRKSADSDQQTQTYQANALNQYTAISGHGTLAHDDDGNMTASGSGWAYEYDGENRLISAESATTRLEHYYDSQSRRFATEVYGVVGAGNYQLLTTTYYLFDGWNLIHELRVVHGSPIATEKRYLWGLDVSGTLQGAGGVGGLLAMADEESGALAAYAYDGNGNVNRLYDLANGAVVGSYEYDPFGNTISQSGPLATANPFRFSTKYLDESGLYYYGYRFYSASMGRWLNRDPIGEAGGVNVYGFVGNYPIGYVDILGLEGWILKAGKFCRKTGKLVLEDGTEIFFRNWKYANKNVTLADLANTKNHKISVERLERLEKKFGKDLSVKYNEFAQPDFGENVVEDIPFLELTGKQAVDSKLAWQYLEKSIKPTEYEQLFKNKELIWHHAGDGKMQLIDQDLHKAFAHTGEASIIRATSNIAKATALALLVPATSEACSDENDCTEVKLWYSIAKDLSGTVDPGVVDAAELLHFVVTEAAGATDYYMSYQLTPYGYMMVPSTLNPATLKPIE